MADPDRLSGIVDDDRGGSATPRLSVDAGFHRRLSGYCRLIRAGDRFGFPVVVAPAALSQSGVHVVRDAGRPPDSGRPPATLSGCWKHTGHALASDARAYPVLSDQSHPFHQRVDV